MSEHLRYLAGHAPIPISVHAQRRPAGAHRRRRRLPADPGAARRRPRDVHRRVRARPGGRLLRHHPRAPAPSLVDRVRAGRSPGGRPRPEPGVASLYQHRAVPPGHLVPGHRRADQRQRVEGVPRGACWTVGSTTASRSPAQQTRDGAHLLDVCVDYVGRDGVARHDARWPAGSPPPPPCRWCSTPPRPTVIEAGPGDARRPGGRQLGQLRGRRRPGLAASPGSCRWSASTAPR